MKNDPDLSPHHRGVRSRTRRTGGCAALLALALSTGVGSAPHALVTTRPSTRVIDTNRIIGLLKSSGKVRALRIARFSATPRDLTADGGRVELDAVVIGAHYCRFASSNVHLSRTLPCSGGARRIVVVIPRNAIASTLTYQFVLAASTGRTTRRKTVSVVEEGRPPPPKPTPPPAPQGSAPVVTVEPTDETVLDGALATLNAAASGSPTPSVQWLISTNGGASWGPFVGATSAPFSFRATLSNNGDEFEAVFSNTAGSATTTAAILSVDAAPAVTTQPADEVALENTSAIFSAGASGSPTPSVQWQVSTDGGASWQPITGATSACYSFTASFTANGDELEAVFANGAGSVTTNAATLTVATGPTTSANWSGYVANDPCALFDSVSASWTVPAVSCSSGDQFSAEWVGIDGDTSSTVEQDGTEGDCSGGIGSYDAWYEMFGDSNVNGGAEVELPPATYPVAPGDTINASVNESGGVWTLALADPTESWNFSTNIGFDLAQQSSAEWIIERPEVCSPTCARSALADFGTITVSNAQAATADGSAAPISDFIGTEIDMENNAQTGMLDQSHPLVSGNFTVAWKAEGP